MAEWFRVLDLKSGDPGFKPFCFLDLFSLVPSLTPRPAGLFKFPTGQPPPPIGILNSLCSISNIHLCLLLILGVVLQTSFRGVRVRQWGCCFGCTFSLLLVEYYCDFAWGHCYLSWWQRMSKGACVLHLTIPGSHLWSCGISIRTGSSGSVWQGGAWNICRFVIFADLVVFGAWCLPLHLQIMTGQVWIWLREVSLVYSGALELYWWCNVVVKWGTAEAYSWRDEDLHRILCIPGGGSSQSLRFSRWNHCLADSME